MSVNSDDLSTEDRTFESLKEAKCLRAKVKLKKSSVVVDTVVVSTANVGRLTVEELKAAQDEILRYVQLTAFPEELKILTVAERANKTG
ncbi:Hypothetical predicted protein [Paramuricea clavata]|uniref:Uncharacterized protein n=1 Tax=Paramuricea clavata TaxID=317549 RepID=A0A6S7HIP2_PARCT|nr:Hypothetical predicted protein [Paramuricea clavata]